MAKTIPDLKALALSCGFRHTQEVVPEWGRTVTLREPAAGAWLRYRAAIEEMGEPDPAADFDQQARAIAAVDAILFVSILLDEDGNRVFSDEDIPMVAEHYGPVHTRLLHRSLALFSASINPSGDAVKKSTLPA